ncbi:MAG TPA: type III-B CRISPR module-associated Cmr3 family protein, partial [Chthonomonadales bacterium]|nr:type III-B CRISPR module-associated Cmr3 family protein [Chthonomonadales bacterium]
SCVVGRPVCWSPWDSGLSRPGPTRYAVPAGAVFFWRKRTESDAPDPHATCISDSDADCQAGWGFCLRGDWGYA